MTSNLRSVLRETTTASHRELDTLIMRRAPFSSKELYGYYLSTMGSLYEEFSHELDSSSDLVGLPILSNCVRQKIKSDLSVLNYEAASKKASFSDLNSGSSNNSEGFFLGVGYTLEGSALGATQLLSVAREKMPSDTPLAFLIFLAENASQRWPSYLKHLQANKCNHGDAISGATSVFQAAIRAFQN